MATKLFVGKLSFDTTSESLQKLFEQYGTVSSSAIIIDKMTNRSRGFGFIEFEDLKAAQTAIKELDGKDFEGRSIVVNAANPPKTSNDRTGRDAGYRRSW